MDYVLRKDYVVWHDTVQSPTFNQNAMMDGMTRMRIDLDKLRKDIMKIKEDGIIMNKQLTIGNKRDEVLATVGLLYNAAIEDGLFVPTNPSPLNGILAHLFKLQGQLKKLNEEY